MNPLYFFAVWDYKMAAVTKNSAEHENDNISIKKKKKKRFGFFVKIDLLENSKLEL